VTGLRNGFQHQRRLGRPALPHRPGFFNAGGRRAGGLLLADLLKHRRLHGVLGRSAGRTTAKGSGGAQQGLAFSRQHGWVGQPGDHGRH
jgi:hypothetical protein